MNRKWIEDFVSPVTQEPLTLSMTEGDGVEITSGVLANDDSRFDILGGIPRFVAREFQTGGQGVPSDEERTAQELQTAHSFGKLWRDKSYMPQPEQSEAVRASLSEQLAAMVGVPDRARSFDDLVKPGMKILNAGCGTGWTETLFKTPEAQRYAIDLSLAVESAYAATRELDNTVVAQANISALPFRNGFFDMIISNGVIHHSSDPSGNFSRLVSKLKPGGMIGIYIYCCKPYLREMADMAIREKTTQLSFEECQEFAAQMTALGESLAASKEPLVLRENIPLLGIKAGSYNLQRFVYDHLVKCFYNAEMGRSYSDGVNVDWYHPKFAFHHTREEIDSWFSSNNCHDVKYIDVPGWEHSGYFVSGKKREDG